MSRHMSRHTYKEPDERKAGDLVDTRWRERGYTHADTLPAYTPQLCMLIYVRVCVFVCMFMYIYIHTYIRVHICWPIKGTEDSLSSPTQQYRNTDAERRCVCVGEREREREEQPQLGHCNIHSQHTHSQPQPLLQLQPNTLTLQVWRQLEGLIRDGCFSQFS